MAAEFEAGGLRFCFGAVDPTGEPCFDCGDVPLLKAFIQYAEMNGRRSDDPVYLCEDCKSDRYDIWGDDAEADDG